MVFGVDVHLYNEDGLAYAPFGLAEFDGPDADTEAMAYAHARVRLHPNASALILLDGDPYAWVSNDTTYRAGKMRRDPAKPVVKYVGRAAYEGV